MAHSESMEKINRRHIQHANTVSISLLSVDELSRLFGQFFAVDTAIANEDMYVVSGVKT